MLDEGGNSINVRYTPTAYDPNSGNYHIQAGSSALDAGTALNFTTFPLLARDFDRQPRSAATPDIGADEFPQSGATFFGIFATASPGGTITPEGLTNVTQGGSQAFAISAPDLNYHLVGVFVDGVSQGTISNFTFSNVQANRTIAAVFAVNTFTITATAGPGGTITPSGTVVVNVTEGRQFFITPNVGFRILDVLVDGVPQGPITTYTFTNVTSNHTLSATFESNIGFLLRSYYATILGRAADAGGLAYWTAEIERIVALGMDVKEGFISVAKIFFNSAEYLARGRTDAEYVGDLFQTFLNRAPTAGETATWVAYIGGASRNLALLNFAFGPEFSAYLQTLFGASTVRPENNLLNDFYRGLLNRLPDSGGFTYWLGLMRAAQCAGAQQVIDLSYQIALFFANSPEYAGRGRNDAGYMEDLYDAIMRRVADLGGYNFWLGALAAGTTRDQVLQFFTNSPEFQTRVQQVINAGCLP